MKQPFTLESIEAENLRSYEYTKLSFENLIVLVGENNEGKSSLLKMLDRLLSIPARFWDGDRVLSEEDFSFWHPANRENHRARRFTINLTIIDGNFGRRYGVPKGQTLSLRFAVKSADWECRLNIGAPRRSETHERDAATLLEAIKRHVTVKLLPPVRDANSSAFAEKVTNSVKAKVQKKLTHTRQAGSPKEYRLALEVIEKVRKIIDLNKENLPGQAHSPLSGMMRSNEVRIDLKPVDVGRLLENALYLYVSTGAHDEAMVLPGETGNGLQSLIDIDLSLGMLRSDSSKEVVVIIEEPEAFLHPSAQRQFMRYLRHAIDTARVGKAVLTTHSPIIVDESRYEEIVLVRQQRHYQPKTTSASRTDINTSLMSVATSEVFFARTVVFVEGESDKALLNTLLRRIIAFAGASAPLCGIVIQPTGSCTFFSPWLRLVDSYATSSRSPFKSLWVMDGDAAAASSGRAAIRGMTDAGRQLKDGARDEVVRFGDLSWRSAHRDSNASAAVNAALGPLGGMFFSCDLEWALFNGASASAITSIRRSFDRCGISSTGSVIDLARRLGSKIEHGNAADSARKNPYIRAAIAQDLPLNDLPPELKRVLYSVLELALGNKNDVLALFARCQITP